jgi:hypothetical protein
MVYVTRTQYSHYCIRVAIDNREMSGHGYAPIKLYFWALGVKFISFSHAMKYYFSLAFVLTI